MAITPHAPWPWPVDIFPHFRILRGILNEVATERRSHETSNALKEGQQEKGPEQPGKVQRAATGLSTLKKHVSTAELYIFHYISSTFEPNCNMHVHLSATRTSGVYCSCGAWWYWRLGSESRSAKTEASAAFTLW